MMPSGLKILLPIPVRVLLLVQRFTHVLVFLKIKYTVNFGLWYKTAFILACCIFFSPGVKLSRGQCSPQIVFDQFGWRTQASSKVAMIRVTVPNGAISMQCQPPTVFEIRDKKNSSVVFHGSASPWKGGAVHVASGDRVWWLDFSALTHPGSYTIYDPQKGIHSRAFEIRNDIYNKVLKTALRAFYYQRCGMAIDAKHGGNWNHGVCHVAGGQDRNSRLWDGSPSGRINDVSGGWHDAGDYNKYVPTSGSVLWDLLMAYEINTPMFGDHNDIPESGNGIPDLLDEVRYELDWLLKMQWDDGGVSNRVGSRFFVKRQTPEQDRYPRYYTGKSSRATAVFAAVTAHAARVFSRFQGEGGQYGAKLRSAAEYAWAFLEKHTAYIREKNQGLVLEKSDMAETGQEAADDQNKRLWAAAELFKTTGQRSFQQYFERHFARVRKNLNSHSGHSKSYFDPAVTGDFFRAAMVYASTETADTDICHSILADLKNALDLPWMVAGQYEAQNDAYRSFILQRPGSSQYTWGSNIIKCRWAQLALMAAVMGVNPPRTNLYLEIAEEYLHYLHGRNPLDLVYLSNMGPKGADLGAEKSVMQMYHNWFYDGSRLYDGQRSRFGPAPGFLVGGPNEYFFLADPTYLAQLQHAPPMKAYKDWNTGWNGRFNEKSWELNEPANSYQAAYIFLLSFYCTAVR